MRVSDIISKFFGTFFSIKADAAVVLTPLCDVVGAREKPTRFPSFGSRLRLYYACHQLLKVKKGGQFGYSKVFAGVEEGLCFGFDVADGHINRSRNCKRVFLEFRG